jgi:hypothetical protein
MRATILTTMAAVAVVVLLAGQAMAQRSTEQTMDQVPGGSAYSGSGGGSQGFIDNQPGDQGVRQPGMGGSYGTGNVQPYGAAPANPNLNQPMRQYPPMGGTMERRQPGRNMGGSMQQGQSGYQGMDNMPMQGQPMPMQPYMTEPPNMASAIGVLQRDGDLYILTSDQGERFTLDFGGTALTLDQNTGGVQAAGPNSPDLSSLVGRRIAVAGVVSQSWSPTSSRQQRQFEAGRAMGGSTGQWTGTRAGGNFATGKIIKVTMLQPAM